MVNQQMIEGYHRAQQHYPQARRFTPGHLETEHGTCEQGRARQLDLLVAIHHDAAPAPHGIQHVDLIVNSGTSGGAAEHANGHLVNRYNEHSGITDHTTPYTGRQIEQIAEVAGPPAVVADRDGGGPPGAEVYSVRAPVILGGRGDLVLNMRQLQPGSGVSVHSLHDVQEGMNKVQAPSASVTPAAGFQERYAQGAQPVPATQNVPPAFGDGQQPPRQRGAADGGVLDPQRFETEWAERAGGKQGVSSQAGLATMHGPRHSVPASPAPDQPGSRFNPIVRERPDMGTTVPAEAQAQIRGPGSAVPDTAPKKKRRIPTAEEISSAGRVGRSSRGRSEARLGGPSPGRSRGRGRRRCGYRWGQGAGRRGGPARGDQEEGGGEGGSGAAQQCWQCRQWPEVRGGRVDGCQELAAGVDARLRPAGPGTGRCG